MAQRTFKYGKNLGLKVFSTCDDSVVDFLEKLKCPIYKIASFEMTDLNLIKKVSKTKNRYNFNWNGKFKIETSESSKTNGVKILHFYIVANYPSSVDDFNLNNIKILKDV